MQDALRGFLRSGCSGARAAGADMAGQDGAGTPPRNETFPLNVVAAGVARLLRSVGLLIKNNELERAQPFSVCLDREIVLPL